MYSERTLIISGSEKGLDGVIGFLKTCGCGSVAVVSSGSEARRMIPHDDYDLILINTPLKDEFGHQLAVKLCESTCSGVILICKADLAEVMVNRTGDYGVCVVSKPLNKQELVKALRIGSAFRLRLLTMQKENNKLRTKLEEMRYVSRAKFLLTATSKKAPWTPGAPGKKCPWKLSQNTNKHRLEKRKTAAERKKLSAAVLFL